MTHDSIGLGEDGPTHQPVEHLASFRAMPNILMMRPGDGNETAGCYKVMLPRHNIAAAFGLCEIHRCFVRCGMYFAGHACVAGGVKAGQPEHACLGMMQ